MKQKIASKKSSAVNSPDRNISSSSPLGITNEKNQEEHTNLATLRDGGVCEETQEDAQKRFEMLADNIPNLTWMANADGYIFWYNSRWYEYTGTTLQQMEGWGWQSVHDPKELPWVLKMWKRSIKNGVTFEMVFPLKGHDGIFRPFLTRVNPVKDSKGKITQWFGTNTEITEQKKVEEKLLDNQKRLAFLVEAGKVLSLSVNYEKTLKNIAKLIVPYFADYTRIVLVDSNKQIKEIAINHIDPQKIPLVKELYESYVDKNTTHGIQKLLQTGKSEIIPEISPEVYTSVKDNVQLVTLLKRLHVTSYMGVVMKLHGEIAGAIVFSSTRLDRLYTPDDLIFAEELATRAALAIENSRLFENVKNELADKKRAEAAFRESEARKTAFFETALDAIITMNVKGEVIEFNPAAEYMFGYTHEEAVGKDLASLIIPDELRNAHRKGLSHYLKTGEDKILNKRIELTAQRKGGKLFPVELTVSKVLGIADTLFTGTIQDITKRKEYENKLASNEERLRLALEAGKIGVWDWDIQNNILVWSDRVFEFYGAQKENFPVTYENFSKYTHPEDRKKSEEAIKNALDGNAEYDVAHRIITVSGEIKWIASRAIVTRDSHGKPLRMLGATSDISEQKK
jgi:PAS domain S-box-containing protein